MTTPDRERQVAHALLLAMDALRRGQPAPTPESAVAMAAAQAAVAAAKAGATEAEILAQMEQAARAALDQALTDRGQ